MRLPALYLGTTRTPTSFASCWVHLQSAEFERSQPFVIEVPRTFWLDAFDPKSDKPDGVSMADFVMARVAEYGTFFLQGVLKSLGRLAEEKSGTYSWVIASVDRAYENTAALVLEGRVVAMDPDRI
jgi:hypothetical protein